MEIVMWTMKIIWIHRLYWKMNRWMFNNTASCFIEIVFNARYVFRSHAQKVQMKCLAVSINFGEIGPFLNDGGHFYARFTLKEGTNMLILLLHPQIHLFHIFCNWKWPFYSKKMPFCENSYKINKFLIKYLASGV